MPIIQAIFENGVFRPVQPVEAQGDEDGKVYWLVAPEDVPKLWADHVAAEVDRGLDAIDRDDVVEWDGAAMRRLAENAATRQADDDLIDEGV